MSEKRPYVREFDWCREQVMNKVIKPVLFGVIQKHRPTTLIELIDAFEKTTGYRVTGIRMNKWLKECGISRERTSSFRVAGYEEPVKVLLAENDLPERIKTIGNPGPPEGRSGMTNIRPAPGFYNSNGGVIG